MTSFEGAVSFPVLLVSLHGAPLSLQLGTADAPLTPPLSATPCRQAARSPPVGVQRMLEIPTGTWLAPYGVSLVVQDEKVCSHSGQKEVLSAHGLANRSTRVAVNVCGDG